MGEPRRGIWPAGWWYDALLLGLFALITFALARGALLGWDLATRDWVDAHRPGMVGSLAGLGNRLGQGAVLTGGCFALAALVAWRRRAAWPVLLVLAAFALTFGVLTPVKGRIDRAAPHAYRPPDNIVHPERFGSGGVSYPSGHLVNALIWYGVLALLLAPWLADRWRWALRVVPPVVLSVTTVYLGYHWLTDTVAGVLLGLLLYRLLGRVDWAGLRLRRQPWHAGLAGPDRRDPERGGANHGGSAPGASAQDPLDA